MKKFLLFIALMISGVGFVNAQSVGSSSIVYYDGYSLKFTVTKLDPAECKVVCDTEPTTPVAVSIPSSVTIEGSTFSVTSIGNRAFYYCDGMTSIEIPNSVTSIGDWAFSSCFGLTSIEIPNSVTSIGKEAFSLCYGLESFVVEGGNPNYDSRNNCNAIIETQTNTLLYGCMNTIIPNSVTSIGNMAFCSCDGLTNIEIPNSVTSIGNSAFYSCDGLTSIEIPNSVTSIGNRAFYNCSGLTSIEIPNSVTSIGNEAFSSCDGLESFVVEGGNPNYDSRNNCNAIIETQTNTLLYGCMNTIIPNSVTSIGESAFIYCSKLTSIEIPNSVTSIGNRAFYCSGLTSIEIPNSVTSIGNEAFLGCSLRSIKCHAVDVPVTATDAFNNCPEDMTIQVPEGSVASYQAAEPWSNYNVTKMYPYQSGDYVVVDYEGYSLRYTIINVEPAECEVICETKPTTEISITIPSSVEIEGVVCDLTKIGNFAFYDCSGLTSIEIPNSVTSIGNSAFASCFGLTSIEIPNSVTSIGICAFYECSGLTSIEIPNSVTSIGNEAFFSCDGLTSIEIPNSITSIGNEAFSACVGLESFVVEGGNPNYDSRNNCNAIIETQTNTLLYGCMNTIIPNSVTSIGNYAFYDCDGLTSIEIPNSVTSIGNRAFIDCSGLTSIEIPNSVTSIGNYAFNSCIGLESFVVEGGNPNYDSRNNCNAIIETQTNTLLYGCMNTIIPNSVTSIGERAFYYCSGLTSIEIPNSVTSIGNEAFSYCDYMTSIEIPNSVTSIGEGAFFSCSGLTSIEIPNSVTSIGNYAFFGCSHLRSIKCHAVDVPVTDTYAFYYCPEDMTIQVPEESVALYQSAEPWSNYNVTKMYPFQNGDYVVVDYEGYSLRYTIINVEPAECEVICETKPTTEISITIPSSVEMEGVVCNVTKIGNYAFFDCSGLTSIEIPNSVTSIGDMAFDSCSGLTSIEIPNSVTSIGNSAFSYCDYLTSIEIPNSVTSIGNSAFSNCNGLTSIEIPNSVTSIGNDAFSSCDGLESFVVEGGNPNYDSRDNCNAIIETQTNTLLYGCMNTIIPNSVTSIGERAFIYCSKLTSIEIPNSVTSIGNFAFYYCSGLTSIEIPNSVTSIGNYAFYDCDGLTSIEIPNSVTSIGNRAFSSCDGLESFVVEGGNPNYDSRDNCNAIIETQTNTLLYGFMNTIIPNSVTSIGNEAFYYCLSLTSIEIPNSVTSIGNYAFSSCSHLRSIKCHAVDVPVTATDAFNNCPEDMTIQVPEGSVASYQAAEPWSNYNVTKMYPFQNGDYVVVDYEGYSLRYTIIKLEPAECEVICETKPTTEISITIPSSVEMEGVVCNVTKIGNEAFEYCSTLTSIEIPNSVTSIGNYAFFDCDGLTSIEIPNSITSIGNEAFYSCSSLERIVVENGNTVYDSRDNCNAIIETQTNTLLYGCMNTIIPNSVTSIGNYAFSYCSKLTSIEIPNSVTSIGNSAFYNCSGLTSIEIPNSVTSIGNSAFNSCYGLTSIEIPNSVTSIGNYAFSNCVGLTSIEIPNSVTSIGNYAFYNCSGLTSIEIPNSVTSIGESAFNYCSNLVSIKCHAVEVPVTAINAFYYCPEDMTIQVPEESVALYQAAEPWSNYNVTKMYPYQNGDYVVVDYEGYSLRYTIIKLEPAECEVICETNPTTEISITIPSSVEIEGVVCNLTKIGNFAFFDCFGLTSIEIPNSVTSIGNAAFSHCSKLTSIEIPNSVTSIGNSAFLRCSSLERIVVENGNTVYDSRNNCNAIIETQTNTLLYGCMNTIIPNSVTSIGYYAFYSCSGLTSIEIPNSVTSIGNYAFDSCYGLTSIEIPNSVTSIGNEAFYNCDGLESFVVEGGNPNYDSRDNCNAIIETQTNTLLYGCMNTIIPNSVTSIGNDAFYNCSGLTSIEIPNSVTSIGNDAFSHCSNLVSIKCHAVEVPVTATYAFYYCPEDMTIQVPEGSVASYQAAEPWENYNIVAGFNSTINLTSNIEEGGFVEGGGNYQDGTEITVYAYVNPNYGFLYWSEDEEIVSYSPEYTFTVSNDRNLTANFAINHWIPDYTIYPNTMAVVGVVQIDGIEQNSSNIEIGAFCGNELRGSNRLFYESKYDRYYLYLTIYGKDDDEISFKIYDHTIESELKLYYNETINFSVDDNIGSSANPMIFNFTTEFLHKRQLSSNWNWYSTFVAVEGRNGFVMLTEGLGELGIQVKSQFAFSNYETGDWNGALNTVSTGNMYMIKMSEPTELSMSGIIVEPSEFPIVLSRNWKWIPYPVSVPMDVTTAFAEFTPHDGDIVKSQEGFTQYYEGIGWSGSLNTMIPGEGYMYQNTSGEEKTLYYPTTGEAKGETKTNITSENNYWKPEVSKYPTNMSVIAVVDHSDELDFEVAAFSNGECRGSARPIYIDGLDKNILFLTIYGEDNETITFRYYDTTSGEEYNISNSIIYSTDSIIGSVKEPYVINLIPANVNEITEKEVCIYPNPVNTNSEIHLTTECDRVEIYNTLGVKIAEYENINSIEGIETSGVYLIKIINEGAIKYDRIIVR